jgi:hypothetical protein
MVLKDLGHLFLAFCVIDVVLKCAVSQIVWVLFVSFFCHHLSCPEFVELYYFTSHQLCLLMCAQRRIVLSSSVNSHSERN